METTNSLVRIVEQSGLDKSKQEYLLEKFSDATAIANEWAEKAKQIVVTDETQIDLMKSAREGRLLLKDKRVEIEKTRKKLKEDSLSEGRAIDTIAKTLTGLIEPTEKYLDDQEKFAERKEAERKKEEEERQRKLNMERIELLVPYVHEMRLNEFAAMNSLGRMPEDQFDALFEGYKASHEKKVAEEKKIEEERIAKEEQDRKDREAQRIENERLKKEAEEREQEYAAERKEAEEKSRREREQSEKILLAERKKAEEKLREEQAGARKLAAELQSKKDEEEKQRLAQEALESAPDKEKIKDLIARLKDFELPEVKSKKAKAIVQAAGNKIVELIDNITQSSSRL